MAAGGFCDADVLALNGFPIDREDDFVVPADPDIGDGDDGDTLEGGGIRTEQAGF